MNDALPQPEIPDEGPVRDPEVLPRLLASLWRRGWSGLVVVKSGDVERRLHLIDGRVQTAVSNDPAESLTAWLVGIGALGSDDVGRAAVHLGVADRGLFFARKLVGLGLVDQATLAQAEADRVVALAEGMLTLRSGSYRLEIGPPPGEMLPQGLDVPRLIATAVLGRWDETWAMNVLGGMGATWKLRLDRLLDHEATGADEAYDLTLLRADGLSSLKDVLAASPLPEPAALKFLAACRLLGLIEAVESARAPRPRALEAAPSPPENRKPATAASANAEPIDGETTRPGFHRPSTGVAPTPRLPVMKAAEPSSRAGRWLIVALVVALVGAVLWFGWVGLSSMGEGEKPSTPQESTP